MDLMELAGPDWKSMSHEDLYHAITTALGGPDAIRPFLPIQDLDELERLYKADHHFNQTESGGRYLTKWDAAAGFRLKPKPIQPPVLEPSGTGLWQLLRRYGVTWMAPSQGVCLLKHAAYELLDEAGRIKQKKERKNDGTSRLPERFRP